MEIPFDQWLDEAVKSTEKLRDDLLVRSQEAGRQQKWSLFHHLGDLAAATDKLRKDVETLRSGGFHEPELSIPAAPETARPRRQKHQDYPKFSIRGDTLIKTGLRRDGQDVYEHAVPRKEFVQVLDRFIAMTRNYRAEKEFAMDEIQEGLQSPVYMTYAMASLLLAEGLLRKVRKGAYVFVRPTQFAQESHKLWDKVLRVRPSP